MHRYDLIVIGSGPAGQRAAIQSAKLGKNVALIERHHVVGGTSVHYGTIPSKTLREAVLYLTGWDQRGLYGRGYRLKPQLTLDDLMQRLRITLQHEIEVIENQLARNGVTVICGQAAFLDPHRLAVAHAGGEVVEYQAEHVLIAVGSRPIRPEGVPFDDGSVIDSDGILCLKRLPKSLIVVGAGVIGVEYASIFSAMDIRVALVDGRSTPLNFLDRELADELVHQLRDQGVILRLGEAVARVESSGNGQIVAQLESGKRLKADLVMYAAGRLGATEELNLPNAGLCADARGRLAVNTHFQTAVPHIYAAGDVIGFPALASTAMEQGRLAACHAFNHGACTPAAHFPIGIYSVPEISFIGAAEHELTEQKIPYEIGVARLRETARGQIMGLQSGVLKMLFGLRDRRLLGVHILGEQATELIHIGQAVLTLGGTLDYFLDNVFNYPTLAEAYKVAALDAWNRIGV